jgi:hypothetical protein
MRTIRTATGLAGLTMAIIGGWFLLDLGFDNLLATLRWLVGGVIAHDAVLAPATIGVVILTSRLLPDWLHAPATVGFIVLGSVTLLAIPVLGRFGARPDNPTLLDRDYGLGWLALTATILAGVLIGAAVRRHGRPARVVETGDHR